MAAEFRHEFADFTGVPAAPLRDGALLAGLLIAGAGAAGFTPMGSPIVRQLPLDGVAAVLMLDGCHITVHSFPARGLLLLDVLALATHDSHKVVDVFARRLAPRDIRGESRARG